MGKISTPQIENQIRMDPKNLSTLLDFIQEAAVLVDDRRIIAVNSKATELTAYTRQELISKPLKLIFKKVDQILASPNPEKFEEKVSKIFVSTRYGTNIPVNTKVRKLNHGLFILIIDPSQPDRQRSEIQNDHSTYYSDILQVIRSTQINDPQIALVKVLEAGCELLETTTIALYIGNSQKPSARRLAHSGKIDIFPTEIYPIDINQYFQASLWTQGQKAITTILHQEASAAGLSYLATCPVGEATSNVTIGLLVAGGYQNTPPRNFLENLQILSDSISNIINKNVLISNLKKKNNEDQQSISILETLINITNEGIIRISPKLKISNLNLSAEAALGFSGIDITNVDVSEVLIGSEQIIPAIELALQGIATSNMEDIYLHRRDGTNFPASLSIYPIQYQDDILGAYVIFQDNSEYEYYQIKARQLEQRAVLGEVTAIFAHEVRNPINNLSTGLQLLAEELEADNESLEIINRMHQDCTRLDRLMESVLTFSRTQNYKYVPLNIGDLLENSINIWRPKLFKYNIDVVVTIPPDEILVYADQQALAQVFTNIISNAIQAMENMPGGTLAIKLSQITNNHDRKIAQIDISDTGSGISSKNRDKIFEPFFSTKINGTGLGLPITKQIITAHKGSINLTSFPGGTVFHIKLPVYTLKENKEQL